MARRLAQNAALMQRAEAAFARTGQKQRLFAAFGVVLASVSNSGMFSRISHNSMKALLIAFVAALVGIVILWRKEMTRAENELKNVTTQLFDDRRMNDVTQYVSDSQPVRRPTTTNKPVDESPSRHTQTAVQGATTSGTPSVKAEEVHDPMVKLRNKVQRDYHLLCARQGLSRLMADRVKTLIVERKQAALVAVEKADREGRDLNGIDVKQESANAQVRMEEQFRAEFGDGFLREYRRHEWLLHTSELVNSVSDSLRRSGTPLTAVQQDQLVALFTQRYGSSTGETTMTWYDPIPYRVPVNEEILRQIAPVLSSTQIIPFLRFQEIQEGRPYGSRTSYP